MEAYVLIVFLQGQQIGEYKHPMTLTACVSTGTEVLKTIQDVDIKLQCKNANTNEVVWDSSLQ